MRAKTVVAALLLGALACSQGFGFELIDRMLGIDAQPSDVEARENWKSYCPTGTCEEVLKPYVPDPTLSRTESDCRPVSYIDAVCRPTAFQSAPCEPACCDACCDPGCAPPCRPFTPVKDLFAGLQGLFACSRCYAEPSCCPPVVCEPAACPPATCDPPACAAPACGPVCCDPCCDPCWRPRPLLGLLNQLSCAVSCGIAMLKPCCCDPVCYPSAGGECGGCVGNGGADAASPDPPPGPSTRPAPEPPLAPEGDSTARRLFPSGFHPASYYRKASHADSNPERYRR